MLIRKPTPQELRTPMLTALPGNNLDTEIEASESKGYFHVSMMQFVDNTDQKTWMR